jgi:hypothetical protein
MNSYRQWTEDNLTIDGFYADPEVEYVQSEPEDTQVNTTQENNLLNNSSSNSNMQRSKFQSPANLLGVFLPPNPNDSSASAPPRPLNAIEDYDEYKNFHYKCMGLKSQKGKNMMINNYRSVLHALAGIKVSSEEDQTNKETLYRMMYSIVAAHLANNCHKLIGNTFNVFAKVPEVKVPDFIIPKLQLTTENYTITAKILAKALAGAKSNEEKQSFNRVQIGKLIKISIYPFHFYLLFVFFFIIGTKIWDDFQEIKTAINAANVHYKDPGSGKTICESLYLARKELFLEYKKKAFKENLRQKKNRLVQGDTESKESFEQRKVQLETDE